MNLIALIAVVWFLCLAVGAVFGILGKIIWLAILVSLISLFWGYVHRD